MTNLNAKCEKVTLILGVMIPIIAVLYILDASQKIFAVTPESGEITGKIEWSDSIGETDRADITLTVVCQNDHDIEPIEQTVSAIESWCFTFGGLDNDLKYEIKLAKMSEDTIQDKGWQHNIDGSIINISPVSSAPEEIVTVNDSTEWDDANRQYGIRRPGTSEVKVAILAHNAVTDYTAIIASSEDNIWGYTSSQTYQNIKKVRK